LSRILRFFRDKLWQELNGLLNVCTSNVPVTIEILCSVGADCIRDFYFPIVAGLIALEKCSHSEKSLMVSWERIVSAISPHGAGKIAASSRKYRMETNGNKLILMIKNGGRLSWKT